MRWCVERVFSFYFFGVHLIFLDGLLFDLFHLIQHFFDDNFADTVTAESREQCNTKYGQVAQQKVIHDWTNICKYNKTASRSQIVLEKCERRKNTEEMAKNQFKHTWAINNTIGMYKITHRAKITRAPNPQFYDLRVSHKWGIEIIKSQ